MKKVLTALLVCVMLVSCKMSTIYHYEETKLSLFNDKTFSYELGEGLNKGALITGVYTIEGKKICLQPNVDSTGISIVYEQSDSTELKFTDRFTGAQLMGKIYFVQEEGYVEFLNQELEGDRTFFIPTYGVTLDVFCKKNNRTIVTIEPRKSKPLIPLTWKIGLFKNKIKSENYVLKKSKQG